MFNEIKTIWILNKYMDDKILNEIQELTKFNKYDEGIVFKDCANGYVYNIPSYTDNFKESVQKDFRDQIFKILSNYTWKIKYINNKELKHILFLIYYDNDILVFSDYEYNLVNF